MNLSLHVIIIRSSIVGNFQDTNPVAKAPTIRVLGPISKWINVESRYLIRRICILLKWLTAGMIIPLNYAWFNTEGHVAELTMTITTPLIS